MSEGMKYEQKLEKVLRQRVTMGETLEGAYDTEPFRALQEINNKFSGNPPYIGATLLGSTQLGYANADSDIDVFVLTDTSRIKNVLRVGTFVDAISDFCKTREYSKHIQPHLVHLDISGIAERIRSVSKHNETPSKHNETPFRLRVFYILCHPMAIGPRINEIRTIVANGIKKMSRIRQNAAISAFAQVAVHDEATNMPRIKERIPGIDADNLFKLGSPRQVVWEKQIRQALGL